MYLNPFLCVKTPQTEQISISYEFDTNFFIKIVQNSYEIENIFFIDIVLSYKLHINDVDCDKNKFSD